MAEKRWIPIMQKVGSWMPVEVQKKLELTTDDYVHWIIREDGKMGIAKTQITVGS